MLFINYVLGLGIGIIFLIALVLIAVQRLATMNLTPEQLFKYQKVIVGGFLVGFILMILLMSYLFVKRFLKSTKPIFAMIEAIKKQDLDMTISKSGIYETDSIIEAMEDMRSELKGLLEKEWRMEQMRREQIAALAHDLKTPLTIVQGYVDLLGETSVDEEQEEYIQLSQESLDQVKMYIKLLIDMSKLDMSKLDMSKSENQLLLNPEEIEVQPFIEDIVNSMKQIASKKQIKCLLKTNIKRISIYGDKLSLKRALINVITNAIDFSPEAGQVIIELQKERESVVITVTDMGSGFSKQALRHGMEQFFMGDKSRSDSMHYGMGLYITYQIITLHQGHIILQNDSQTEGAKVIIELPLHFSKPE